MFNHKMRIIHIITQLELGGAQHNTLYTLKKLDRLKFEPVLITGKKGVLVPRARALKEVKCVFLSTLHRRIHPVWDVVAFFHLFVILQKARKQNPRICIHTHSSKAGILGRWAAFAAGIRLIVHSVHGFGFHDYQSPLIKKIFIFLEKISARITSQIIFVSQADFTRAVQLGICKQEGQGRVIRSGINLKQFWREQNALTRHRKLIDRKSFPLIGMIACFKPQKSPLDFLYMASLVSRVFPEARFMMVGDGEMRPLIQHLAEELSLQDRLTLAGWRKDIRNLLPEFNVLVLTSLWEGLPRVLVEATALGIPIVATNINGNHEIIRQGVNGYLAPPRNPSIMAEKVISLLQNPGQLSYTEENRRSLLHGFDIHYMVAQQERMYQKLMENSLQSFYVPMRINSPIS